MEKRRYFEQNDILSRILAFQLKMRDAGFSKVDADLWSHSGIQSSCCFLFEPSNWLVLLMSMIFSFSFFLLMKEDYGIEILQTRLEREIIFKTNYHIFRKIRPPNTGF